MKNVIHILFLILLPLSVAIPQVNREWVQRYDGPASGLDLASGMLITSNGELLVYGHSTGIGTQLDLTILKYSSSGALLWDFRYNGTQNGADHLQSLKIDNNGSIYAVGNVTNFSGIVMTVAKLSFSGSLEWIKRVDLVGYENSYGQDVVISPSGSIYACGFARNLQNNFDLVITKISGDGIIQWIKTYDHNNGNNDSPVNILCDGNENLYLVSTSADLSGNESIVCLKYNSNGDIKGTFAYPVNSRAVSSVLDSSGHIAITGVTYSQASNFDYLTIRLSSMNFSYWYKTYNGTGNHIDYPYKIITDNESSIYVTGSSRNSTTIGSEDVLTVKYDSTGKLLWTNRFDSHLSGSDIGYALTLDENRNVYVAAAIDRDTNHLIFGTMKIKTAGDLEWLRSYEYYHSPEDFPYAIAVDTSNNVYTSGISFGGPTDYDITTIKYSQSVNISTVSNVIPEKFKLHQNYPNPFNPVTLIRFENPLPSKTGLFIYNSAGELIYLRNLGNLPPGTYDYSFDGSNLSSGIYYYTIQSRNSIKTLKMALVK